MERVVMPRGSALMRSGVVTEILVQDGQQVKAGAALFTIEAEKVMMDLPAPADGFVRILCAAGEEYPVGAELAFVAESEDELSRAAPEAEAPRAPAAKAEVRAAPTAPAAHSAKGAPLRILPIARKLIIANHLDASQITGTGAGGAITREDVQKYLETLKNDGAQLADQPEKPLLGDGDRAVPLDRIKQAMMAHMSRGREVVQCTTFMEMDLSAVKQLRSEGKKHSYTSFLVKAVADSVRKHMEINSSLDGDHLIVHGHINIGVALDLEGRLLVPVIQDADKLSVEGIEKEILRFQERAKAQKLSISDMSGGTITVTNSGVFGSTFFAPVVNFPQVAIIGLPKIVERPVVCDGQIVIRPIMTMSLSYDHRVVEGSLAVGLLADVKKALERAE